MKIVKNIFKIMAIIIVIIFGAITFGLSRQVSGYRAFVVMSASMEPEIPTGSLIISKKISPYDVHKGDIVTFIRPDNPKEYVTHRIAQTTKLENGVPVFKTRGDNNNNDDQWTLVGGGIVGKEIKVVPHLGYLLSLAKTKVGIALLIILPAILIIFDEIMSIFHIIRKRPTTQIIVLLIGFSFIRLVSPTYAILSDQVTLTNNSFSVALLTTPTPTPNPTPQCGNSGSITITGNGEGSINTVTTTSDCSNTVNQSNDTDVNINVNVDSSTGGNSNSGNTGGSTTVHTASSSSSVVVNVSGGTNN